MNVAVAQDSSSSDSVQPFADTGCGSANHRFCRKHARLGPFNEVPLRHLHGMGAVPDGTCITTSAATLFSRSKESKSDSFGILVGYWLNTQYQRFNCSRCKPLYTDCATEVSSCPVHLLLNLAMFSWPRSTGET
jgi:hypothetical protein